MCNLELTDDRKVKFKHFCNHSCKAKHEWKSGSKDVVSGKVSTWNLKRYIESPQLKFSITKNMNAHVRKYGLPSLKGRVSPMKGRTKETDGACRRCSERMKKNNPMKNPETVKKVSDSMKKLYRAHPEKHPNRIIAAKMKRLNRKYVSKGQLHLYYTIKDMFPEEHIVLEHPIKTKGSVRFADVAIPLYKLDWEYDGAYWHNKEKDAIRDAELKSLGWTTIRIPESAS